MPIRPGCELLRLASCLAAGRGAAHDGCDLFGGHGEHVVQHEREPFGGSQPFEYHEYHETDRVGR